MKTEQEIVLQKKMIIIFSLVILTIIMGILNIQKEKNHIVKLDEYDDSIIKVYTVYNANEEMFKIEVSGDFPVGLNVEEFQSGEEVEEEVNSGIIAEDSSVEEVKQSEVKESKQDETVNAEAEVKEDVNVESGTNEIEQVEVIATEIEVNDEIDSVVSRGSYIRDSSTPPTEYEKVIKVKATAYCLCKKCCGKSPDNPRYGYTASGLRIVPGTGMKVIAVDTNVVPLGTNVYVEGLNGARNYGYAVAADTGSAIKNNKIDLYMDTHGQALAWGVKYVNLYILSE